MINTVKRGAKNYARSIRYEVRRNRNGNFYVPWRLLITIAILILLFPFAKKLFKNLSGWLERTFSFLSGDGGVNAQAQQEMKEKAEEKMIKGFDKWNINPSVQDYHDAAQIAKWNNEYRGFVQSMWSTNVPHSAQIKVLNLLGFCVPDGNKMYYPSGLQADKLYPNIMNDFNRNVDQYRLAGIIKAYGSIALPDRQTFITGYFLENTTGTLPKHIQEFYCKEYADMFLPYIYSVINKFS